MKVLIVSQCSKNALIETRRILDQFAERKGDSVWETNITEHGLETIKRLLKSTARRNTAVACHLLRGRLQTGLLWIVGNQKKFNREGIVPTNITAKDVLRSNDENEWNSGEAIAILAAIAGLFHDFGKANVLFQNKLRGKGKSYEPFRHEWISLILFKQFVGTLSDKEWLEKLSKISSKDERELLSEFPEKLQLNPLKDLPRVAKFIGWLILSHHKLPVWKRTSEKFNCEPPLEYIDEWMESKCFHASWNSPNWNEESEKLLKQNICFKKGTLLKSKLWCAAAHKIAKRALKSYGIIDQNWFEDRFSMHLIRLALMLSDHYHSARPPYSIDADMNELFANTESYVNPQTNQKSRRLKQRLHSHNIGVAYNAFIIAKAIPRLKEALPFSKNKEFKKRSRDSRFLWQDKAFDLACSLKENSKDQGFFGINLASTGCGKTLANAKIMYGLSDEALGARFNIALGLRILTLQTGDALRKRLFLKDDDLAVMIGSKEFQELYELKNDDGEDFPGSESAEDLMDELDIVDYAGSLDDSRLKRWFGAGSNAHKMISAPILVSTIDHLILATEGCRGGKQIAPILRLLTSDLVLDEPDDFNVEDLPALCRLVNFAGVFGSKVLLSSATLPPSMVNALFDAYVSGRKAFNRACKNPSINPEICTAWFDEFTAIKGTHATSESFMASHKAFIEQRILKLEKQPVLRLASLVPVGSGNRNERDAEVAVSEAIRDSLYKLHDNHHQILMNSGKKVSIGLVRMANIDPMVAVVKEVISKQAESNYCIHFCVYHSKFPALIRSNIEESLDNVLSRHDPIKLEGKSEICSALLGKEELNHIFVVFATSVAEVGRDHDYDWAIVEPSSMRSIIQLAGRVQRHRQIPPSEPNIVILQKNIKALIGADNVVYTRPGFESEDFILTDKDLSICLRPSQYEKITAIPRLLASEDLDYKSNLSDLEHTRLQSDLLGMKKCRFNASLWWKHCTDWSGELQRRSRFRKSNESKIEYFYYLEESGEPALLHTWLKGERLTCVDSKIFFKEQFKCQPGMGVYPWFGSQMQIEKEIEKLSEKLNIGLLETSRKFAWIKLGELPGIKKWTVDPILGFYRQ